MKAFIAAFLLLLSAPIAYDTTAVNLESHLTSLSLANNDDFVALSIKFIDIGQFGSGRPYHPVIADKKTVKTFTECVDAEYTPMYNKYGYDTQVGTLFIGCAYKLGWLD